MSLPHFSYQQYLDHPCMVYLPIYIWLICIVNVGKYTSFMDEYTIHGHMPPALGSLGGLEEEVSKDAESETRTATRCLRGGCSLRCMTQWDSGDSIYLIYWLGKYISLPILDSSLPILGNIRDLWSQILYSSITRSWFQMFFYFHPDPWGNDSQFDLRIFFRGVGSTTN